MILRRLNTLQAVQGFLSSIHQLDLSIFYLNNLHEGKKTASNLHPHYDLGLFFAILLMALFASQLNTQKISSFTFHKVDLTTIFCSQRWHSWKSLRNPLLVSCYFAYYFFQQQMRLNLQRHVKGQQKSHHKNPRKKTKQPPNPTNPTIQPRAPHSKPITTQTHRNLRRQLDGFEDLSRATCMDLLLDTIKIFLGHEVVAKPGGWLFGGGRQMEVKRISFLWVFPGKRVWGCWCQKIFQEDLEISDLVKLGMMILRSKGVIKDT